MVDQQNEFDVLAEIVQLLRTLSVPAREKVLRALMAVFNDSGSYQPTAQVFLAEQPRDKNKLEFAGRRAQTVKEFLLEKQPKTDVERVACLAFYLTHYMELPHFKTGEISKVNTDAAQPKFSNAAYAVNNATKSGYLAAGPKGTRQLSAAGERFVQELPDREKAKSQMSLANRKPRKRSKTVEKK